MNATPPIARTVPPDAYRPDTYPAAPRMSVTYGAGGHGVGVHPSPATCGDRWAASRAGVVCPPIGRHGATVN